MNDGSGVLEQILFLGVVGIHTLGFGEWEACLETSSFAALRDQFF